jgi:hypothetical protein
MPYLADRSKLVAGEIELRAHFGKLVGFIHNNIIVGSVFLYLIGVAFVVKQGN